MNGRWIVLLAAVAIPGSAGSATAQTEHFNFAVPVQVHNLLDGEDPRVVCSVLPSSTAPLTDDVGYGSTGFSIDAGGNFSGIVDVRFNAFSDKDPASATYYRCSLMRYLGPYSEWFSNDGDWSTICQIGPDMYGDTPPVCIADPGSGEWVNPVTGPIP